MSIDRVMITARWTLSIAAIGALIAVEACYFAPPVSWLRHAGGVVWLGLAVSILASTWIQSALIHLDRSFWQQRHQGWYILGLILPPLLIFVGAGGVRLTSIDGEGVLQTVAGLQALREDPGLGVYNVAYYYYIARQYVLACLPSYIFGPGLWTLRLGNSLFYLGSYYFFLAALVRYLREKRVASPLLFAAWCGLVITLGGYALQLSRKFEQTMMPSGGAMLWLASLLLYLLRPSPLRLLWVTWSFGFLADGYTPALAMWALAAVALAGLILQGRRSLAVPLLYGIVTLVVASLIRHANPNLNQFRLGTPELIWSDWVFRYLRGIQAMFGPELAVIPPPLFFGAAVALYISWRTRERKFPIVVLWSFGVALASLTFIGSNLGFAFFDAHRAMVVLAPLALGAVLTVTAPRASTLSVTEPSVHLFLKLGILYMVATSVFVPFSIRNFMSNTVPTNLDECVFSIIELQRGPAADRPRLVAIVPPLDLPVDAFVSYFAPEARVIHTAVPPESRQRGTYAISLRYEKPDEHYQTEMIPSLNPRPYLKVEKCWE